MPHKNQKYKDKRNFLFFLTSKANALLFRFSYNAIPIKFCFGKLNKNPAKVDSTCRLKKKFRTNGVYLNQNCWFDTRKENEVEPARYKA